MTDEQKPDELRAEDEKFENVIPEFSPCGGEGGQEAETTKKAAGGKAPGRNKGGPSLTQSDIPEKSKKAKKKAAIAESMMSDKEKQLMADLNLGHLDDKAIKALINQGVLCFKCRIRAPNYCQK